MTRILSFLFVLSALTTAYRVTASEPVSAQSDSLLLLTKRVQALETRATTWDRIASRLPNISGYLQLGYQWSENESSFLIKRARMTFSGEVLRGKIDYSLQLEFAGTPKIIDAFVAYKPFSQLNLKIGEFKVPFTIETTAYAPQKLELIDYSLVLRKLMGYSEINGISAAGRDLGAALYGGFLRREGYSIINYDLAVFNGSGINVADQNRSKDVVGRLIIKPMPGLQLSGAYYWGEFGKQYAKRIRYTGGACYDRDRLAVRAEWVGGVTGMPDGTTGALTDMTSDGWYVQVGVRMLKNRSLMPVFRFDQFRQNVDVSATYQNNYTVGLLWQPIKYLRCQLNYIYEDYTHHTASNRNVVAVMFMGMF